MDKRSFEYLTQYFAKINKKQELELLLDDSSEVSVLIEDDCENKKPPTKRIKITYGSN